MTWRTLDALVATVRQGDPRAVGRAISLVENDAAALRDLMRQLAPDGGRARVVGLTGPPGVGKSTLTASLVGLLRDRGERVGVLAVDPSSPFSGGALLGDRIRMQAHALDREVFIRSMATRGHLGGLAVAVPQALRVLDAARCDTVLLETVGVGQSEIEVAGVADTTVVLVAPGMGDGIQAAKAGILEVADVFVVNKSDHDGAHAQVRELRTMLASGEHAAGAWRPPIVSTVAVRGEAVPEVLQAIEQHEETARRTGQWQHRRLRRAREEVEALALAAMRARFRLPGGNSLDAVAAQVRDGALDPYSAAERLVPRTDEIPASLPRRSGPSR